MAGENELTWEIILLLYRDEEKDALNIASLVLKSRSEVNRILYHRRDLFSKRASPYSARPMWSLTNDGIEVYDLVHANSEINVNMPLFCDECGALSPDHYLICSNYTSGNLKILVPSNVNYGKMGLPRFFGISYSEKDSDFDVNNRREIMLDFLVFTFVPVESNTTYVKSYGVPRTQQRRKALINHLEGINLPATTIIQQLRNADINWLLGLDLELELP